MKTTILAATVLGLLAGCSGAARTPEVYRDDVGAALAVKSDAIRACYDGVLKSSPGAAGKVTVAFDVETEHGKVTNVRVDPAGTTAPAAVAECVTRSIDGVALAPPDGRMGQGAWVYQFNPPGGPGKT